MSGGQLQLVGIGLGRVRAGNAALPKNQNWCDGQLQPEPKKVAGRRDTRIKERDRPPYPARNNQQSKQSDAIGFPFNAGYGREQAEADGEENGGKETEVAVDINRLRIVKAEKPRSLDDASKAGCGWDARQNGDRDLERPLAP